MGLPLGLPLGLLLGLMLKLLLGLLGCTTHVPVMCQGRFCDTVTKMILNLVIKKWRVAIWVVSSTLRSWKVNNVDNHFPCKLFVVDYFVVRPCKPTKN